MSKVLGQLYLIPNTLGESALDYVIPQAVKKIAQRLTHFVVENEKSARAHLKRLEIPVPIAELKLYPLERGAEKESLESALLLLQQGRDVGLLSDAGCPCVADPGAEVVRAAQASGIKVTPLVGPSSILLALMGSGLNGQQFAFHGYLPVDAAERKRAILRLEEESVDKNQTQIFMETPYRNEKLFHDILECCKNTTLLCVATGLTLENESLLTRTIKDWRGFKLNLDRVPTIFLLYRGSFATTNHFKT